MTASEKVAYLKGLAEGLGVKADGKEGKLMLAVIDVLESLAGDTEALEAKCADLADSIDDIGEDMAYLEDLCLADLDEDEDEYEDDEYEDDGYEDDEYEDDEYEEDDYDDGYGDDYEDRYREPVRRRTTKPVTPAPEIRQKQACQKPKYGEGADPARYMSNNPDDYRIDIDPKFFETSTLPKLSDDDAPTPVGKSKDSGRDAEIEAAMKKMEDLQKEIERLKQN